MADIFVETIFPSLAEARKASAGIGRLVSKKVYDLNVGVDPNGVPVLSFKIIEGKALELCRSAACN